MVIDKCQQHAITQRAIAANFKSKRDTHQQQNYKYAVKFDPIQCFAKLPHNAEVPLNPISENLLRLIIQAGIAIGLSACAEGLRRELRQLLGEF